MISNITSFFLNNRSHGTFLSELNATNHSSHKSLGKQSRKNSLRVRITWYRDGRRLSNSRKIRIRQKRWFMSYQHFIIRWLFSFYVVLLIFNDMVLLFRYVAHNSIRSILRVRNANTADRGNFECRLRPKQESKLHRVRKVIRYHTYFKYQNKRVTKNICDIYYIKTNLMNLYTDCRG